MKGATSSMTNFRFTRCLKEWLVCLESGWVMSIRSHFPIWIHCCKSQTFLNSSLISRLLALITWSIDANQKRTLSLMARDLLTAFTSEESWRLPVLPRSCTSLGRNRAAIRTHRVTLPPWRKIWKRETGWWTTHLRGWARTNMLSQIWISTDLSALSARLSTC